MSGPVPAGSVLLDPADAAVAAWAMREAIRALGVAGRPVPTRLAGLAATLTAAAAAAVGDSASAVRPDRAGPAASPADLTVEVVPVSEAAALLSLSRSRVRQLIAAGELPAQRAGKRVLLVDRAAAAALAATRTTRPEGA